MNADTISVVLKEINIHSPSILTRTYNVISLSCDINICVCEHKEWESS